MQGKLKQPTKKLQEKYKDFIIKKISVQGTCTEKEKVHYNHMKGKSIKVVDGGNQSVFSGNNLPIHHLVVEGHHAEI